MAKKRCAWVNMNNELYVNYHDTEWGVPVFDDYKLFAMLTLEGAQAGLSWETVLNKRDGYYQAFDNFDFEKISSYKDSKQQQLLQNPMIIRNRLKIQSTINNAKIFIDIRSQFSTFANYIWAFVDHKPIINSYKSLAEIPATTKLSDIISKDLKKRGMKFVGSTIIYAFMQAIGMVNDHEVNCFRYKELSANN